MAKKAPSKTPVNVTKKAVRKTTSKAQLSIEKVSEQVLAKLQSLKLEPGLQNDIEWCLGSFKHDKNPIGLYEMGKRALLVLKSAKDKNAKAVPSTLIASLTKVLASK
jgi:hypothetical protein